MICSDMVQYILICLATHVMYSWSMCLGESPTLMPITLNKTKTKSLTKWVRLINPYWMVLLTMSSLWVRGIPFWNTQTYTNNSKPKHDKLSNTRARNHTQNQIRNAGYINLSLRQATNGLETYKNWKHMSWDGSAPVWVCPKSLCVCISLFFVRLAFYIQYLLWFPSNLLIRLWCIGFYLF